MGLQRGQAAEMPIADLAQDQHPGQISLGEVLVLSVTITLSIAREVRTHPWRWAHTRRYPVAWEACIRRRPSILLVAYQLFSQ